MTSKTIFQGAEAKIILSNDFIIKDRVKKSYRIPELDEKIRKRRTKTEARLLDKASKIISSPKPFFEPQISFKIKMSFIDGKKLSDNLDTFSKNNQLKLFKKIGEQIAKLHDSDIIHGDLTTSNMILDEKDNQIYFVDFGLGFISHKIEDKAVDLHLLKQALDAKHFKHSKELFKEVVKGYKISKDNEKVFERLKQVETRGRYKDKY